MNVVAPQHRIQRRQSFRRKFRARFTFSRARGFGGYLVRAADVCGPGGGGLSKRRIRRQGHRIVLTGDVRVFQCLTFNDRIQGVQRLLGIPVLYHLRWGFRRDRLGRPAGGFNGATFRHLGGGLSKRRVRRQGHRIILTGDVRVFQGLTVNDRV